MNFRVLRGADEIGGNCIELECQGKRIVLDLGRPLDAAPEDEVPLPAIAGLATGDDPSLLGVILSHSHADHWGLVPQVAQSVPIYIGEAAARVLRAAAFFSPVGADLRPAGFLRDRTPFQLGPFTITPYLVDHSAFDAYALLVEAEGERLFYTGDFRAHGRKAALFERLLRAPPKNVTFLLTEATNIRPDGEPPVRELTETEVERRCIAAFQKTPGLALAVYSAQNIDRLVTLYRAALQADRDFVMDLYVASVAQAAGSKSIPQPGPRWPRVRVYVPQRQRIRVKASREFARVEAIRSCRIFGREIAARKSGLVMTFRRDMTRELERAGALGGASVTWSLWDGYLKDDRWARDLRERLQLPIRKIHASGHAYPAALQALVRRLAPAQVVPIHCSASLETRMRALK